MALNTRNYMPPHGIRVPAEVHEAFAAQLLRAAGLRADGADLVAGILVACDRRCVFSHGTKRMAEEYLRELQEGGINADPSVKVERQDGATAVIDGDGGLGYHACHQGMTMAIDAARRFGVGAVTTYNHHHFGAAGNWTRMAIREGFVGLAVSSHRFRANPEHVVTRAVGSSPLSIGIPAGNQPPFVLDMGGASLPSGPELMEQIPHVFFKGLGVASISVILGGVLAGIWRPEIQSPASKWKSNQGSFLSVWDVSRFMDPAQFAAEMDRHMADARAMQPFPGMDRAELPGGMEHAWEQQNTEHGIPMTDAHVELLAGWAQKLGVEVPYGAYENTRF
ncbi:MAG: Ldh family oxidoreductase [bacterium]|nr:Ldh family oxidoreductase [bacterium]